MVKINKTNGFDDVIFFVTVVDLSWFSKGVFNAKPPIIFELFLQKFCNRKIIKINKNFNI